MLEKQETCEFCELVPEEAARRRQENDEIHREAREYARERERQALLVARRLGNMWK